MLRIKYFATMHGNLFNITLKNVHNIKATHGNTPSPFKGEGEGSFDINRGTKKKYLSAQDAIFLSISIICFSQISYLFCLFILHHPSWFNPPTTPSFRERFSLPTPLPPVLSTPLRSALLPPQSLVALSSSITVQDNNIVNDGK